MNHKFGVHSDGTLEIVVPSGIDIDRVFVRNAATNMGNLYYPNNIDGVDSDEFIKMLNVGIESTNTDDDYCLGFRNALRFAIACYTGEDPKYETKKER